jgi:hypothetical protein
MDAAVQVIGAVRELVGDHLAHQPCFVDFPAGVPDTVEFWLSCLRTALTRVGADETDAETVLALGPVNLYDMPLWSR